LQCLSTAGCRNFGFRFFHGWIKVVHLSPWRLTDQSGPRLKGKPVPPTVTASQAQPSATLLNSPLTRDVIITLQWEIQDEHEVAEHHNCTVQLGAQYALAAEVGGDCQGNHSYSSLDRACSNPLCG
jgi:hypothetical protein